jgi:DNA-binding LacI/PurR family transcriptional regulator
MAQSLVNHTSPVIAVIISNISDPFFSPIVRGIEDVANKFKHTVMIGNSDENYLKAKDYLAFSKQHCVAGVIVSPTSQFNLLHHQLQDLNIPITLVNRRSSGLDVDVVETDNQLGAYLAIKHLISLNHFRIGIVLGPTSVSTYYDRLQGYYQAFQEKEVKVNEELIKVGGYHDESAYQLTLELLNLPNPPTAIFVGSGRLSRGSFRAIKELKLSLPRDLSFITYDETEWGALVNPSLTCIAQQTYKMGENAAQLLLERINHRKKFLQFNFENKEYTNIPRRTIKIKPKFIIRSSTSKLKIKNIRGGV